MLVENKKTKNRNKATANSIETIICKILKAKKVPASGAGYIKGDGIDSRFLYEIKFKNNISMRFQGKWIEKISREARGEGRIPCIVIILGSYGTNVFFPVSPAEIVLKKTIDLGKGNYTVDLNNLNTTIIFKVENIFKYWIKITLDQFLKFKNSSKI